jgi:site-specific recombinase XerD
MSPRKAVERWLNERQVEMAESSISSYYYRLKLWVAWCEEEGIDHVDELDGWLLDQYQNYRRGQDITVSALNNEMDTLKQLMDYLERVEAVQEGLAEKVPIPEVPDEKKADEEMLDPVDAKELIQHYRNAPTRATREHAFLEVAWHTGARMGGIRALDIRDVQFDENYVSFKHRPNTDTPLKNKTKGERPVAVPGEVMDVLEAYLEHHRVDRHDDHGRQPLLTTTRGRPGTNSLRVWSYQITQPCVYEACPHGRDRDTCEYREYHNASKCPSSRSPHKLRTGSITWQRDLGFPPAVVAERVNSSIEVIEQYYDQQSALERLERRRRPYISRMDT